jgi:hypothetical protein
MTDQLMNRLSERRRIAVIQPTFYISLVDVLERHRGDAAPAAARAGLRCQTSRYGGKPSRVLYGARGWRHRLCPSCNAPPGERCRTPTGRQASQPHTARGSHGRLELFADEDVWQELERWGATVALGRRPARAQLAGAI